MSNSNDFKKLNGPSERYKLWLTQASYDLEASGDSLKDNMYEWSCYQAVQSVEKCLKSVIIHAGWRPPKTHKLGVLLGICNRANTLFRNVKFDFRKVETFTFISRYPFVVPGEANVTPHDLITKEDAETCVSIAKDIYGKVEQFIGENKVTTGTELDLEHYYFTDAEVNSRIKSVISLLEHSDNLKLEKVIVFGSFARDQAKPRTSTMDMLIVAETDLPFIKRIEYVRELTKEEEPILEPLVYTQQEFDYMIGQEREGFLESAIEEGRVVYPQSS